MNTKSYASISKHFAYSPDTGDVFRIDQSGLLYPLKNINSYGYIRTKINGAEVRAHQIAWTLYYGAWPCAIMDHINRDRTDNRILNLRLVTPGQSSHNCGPQRSGKVPSKGVFLNKNNKTNPYTAVIRKGGVKYYLGDFPSEHDAAKAYIEKARELYGEFAYTPPAPEGVE